MNRPLPTSLPPANLTTANESVFARLFDRIFTLSPLPHFPSSLPTLPSFRDGTDPLLAGHRPAAPLRHSAVAGGRA
jgi:hypothetical protein